MNYQSIRSLLFSSISGIDRVKTKSSWFLSFVKISSKEKSVGVISIVVMKRKIPSVFDRFGEKRYRYTFLEYILRRLGLIQNSNESVLRLKNDGYWGNAKHSPPSTTWSRMRFFSFFFFFCTFPDSCIRWSEIFVL